MATHDEQKYLVFATIRNPLDKIVSTYFKLKTNHKGAFSAPDSAANQLIDYADIKKYQFIQENDMGFVDYFRKYQRKPYSDMIDYSADSLNYVMKYEELQQEFVKVMEMLGIKAKRSIPVTNKTATRTHDWKGYYLPEIREQAVNMCGPFMHKWDYSFPDEWGMVNVPVSSRLSYVLLNYFRGFYINRFKYNDATYAQMVRRLRASIVR